MNKFNAILVLISTLISSGFSVPEVIHPEWREQAYPNNNEAIQNPPILYVPSDRRAWKDDFLSHDFQLSKSKDFKQMIDQASDVRESFLRTKISLVSGEYFWRYRKNGGTWQGPFKLNIGQGTWSNEAPAADKLISAINSDHPRILVRKEKQAEFQRNLNKIPYSKSVIKSAKKYFDVELADKEYGGKFHFKGTRVFKNTKFPDDHPKAQPQGRVFRDAIKTLCKAYIISGDAKYAKEALRWAERVAEFEVFRTQFSEQIYNIQDSFSYAALLEAMVYAYDTCYDHMTDQQRKAIYDSLYARTDSYYRYFINRLEARVIDNHAWQHTFLSFAEAAIALKGHAKEADEWLSYSYNVWMARQPIQSTFDGGWNNGSYFSVNIHTLISMPVHFSKYTGYNYYQHPWFKNQVKWHLYRQPPSSEADGFGGDGYEKSGKGISEKTAVWLNILDAELNIPEAGYLAAQAKDFREDKFMAVVWTRLSEGLALKSSEPVPQKIDVAQSHLFEDTGIVNMNTDVLNGDNNNLVSFRSSPYGGFGHNLSNQNSFTLVHKGESLFVPFRFRHGGKKHAFQCYRHTRGHNGVTIDDKGQPISSEAYGRIARFLSTDELDYVCGDASKAYSGEPSPQWWDRVKEADLNWYDEMEVKDLKKFRRHVLFLKPSTILIYDDLEADAEKTWELRLHCRKTLAANANQLMVKEVDAKVNYFSNSDLDIKVYDEARVAPFNVDRRGGTPPTIYKSKGTYASIATQDKAKSVRVLTVIQLGETAALVKQSDSKFSLGKWQVKAELDPAKPAVIAAENTHTATSFISENQQGESQIRQGAAGSLTIFKDKERFPRILK